MSILAWIVLGVVAGFIGSKTVNKTGEGLVLDLVLGVVGALVGGFLFNTFGHEGVTGLNIYSLLVGHPRCGGGAVRLSPDHTHRLSTIRPSRTAVVVRSFQE